MVKHKRYPKGFAAIPVTALMSLGTLADGIVLDADIFSNDFLESFWANSFHGTWSIRNHTITEGPITVGMAHSDYTVTEILEKLVADEANNRGDMVAREQSRRKVRRVGAFGGANTDEVLNDGKLIKLALKFKIPNTMNLAMWARNQSGASLTTGTQVLINGTLYGRYMG